MNETINKETIKSMIHEVKEKYVILASDLAKVFQMETKNLNKAARRNLDKFTNRDYFQLMKTEYEEVLLRLQNESSRFQFGTLKKKDDGRGSNIKYLPYAFTKEGVITLATILKSEKVRKATSIILEAFNILNNKKIALKNPEIQGKITSKIYEIRGKQVMLDSDLANLYKVETKRINEAVKNNPKKFPERFSWKLTDQESQIFLVEIFDQKIETRGGKYKNPRVFTEEGVAMLATILNSDIATKVSIAIMDAFVAMRHFLIENQEIYKELGYHSRKLIEHDEQLSQLFSKFENNDQKELLYFEMQVYDAYSKIIDIMSSAKKELIIIDNYADKSVLDMISRISVTTKLIVKSPSNLTAIDVKKYQEQYNNLKIIYSNIFHDRYLILDETIIYHCGASLNKAGSKIFSINKLEEKEIKDALIIKIKNLK